MPAEEREPMSGASRRTLLTAALALPLAGAAATKPAEAAQPPIDAAFVQAEREYDLLCEEGDEASRRAVAEGLVHEADGDADALYVQAETFGDFITDTPCTTRQSAAVKLRHMIKTTTVHDEPEDAELEMLRHVLAYLEGA